MERNLPLLMSPDAIAAASMLLDQQLFCWGEDIKRDEGNLLLEYGLTRERPTVGMGSCPLYRQFFEDGKSITLWGFGLFYSCVNSGGIYLSRIDFAPIWTPQGDAPGLIWQPCHLPRLHLPRSAQEQKLMRSLLQEVCAWMAAYEIWVTQSCGEDWRRQCVAQWWKPQTPAEQIASDWLELACFFSL